MPWSYETRLDPRVSLIRAVIMPPVYAVVMIIRLVGSSRTSDLASALISSGLQWLPQLAALIRRSGVVVVIVNGLVDATGCRCWPRVLTP